jgi:hypothetical protein
MKLLTSSQLAAVRSALNDVVDTFYVTHVTYVKRVVSEDQYGENTVANEQTYDFRCKIDYSVGKGERYENIEQSNIGQVQHPTWHIRFWKADLDAQGVTVDAEHDSIRYLGKEYNFNFAAEDGAFSDLGTLFYEVEIHYE